MFFDQLLQRVDQRVTDYARSHQSDTVLSDEALAEATELWQAAQSANTEHLTPVDKQRLAAACEALGWLHFLRGTALSRAPSPLGAWLGLS